MDNDGDRKLELLAAQADFTAAVMSVVAGLFGLVVVGGGLYLVFMWVFSG